VKALKIRIQLLCSTFGYSVKTKLASLTIVLLDMGLGGMPQHLRGWLSVFHSRF